MYLLRNMRHFGDGKLPHDVPSRRTILEILDDWPKLNQVHVQVVLNSAMSLVDWTNMIHTNRLTV